MIQQLLLAILTFVHRWDGARLHGSVLLVPSGDPTRAFLPGANEPFAGTEIDLRAVAVAIDGFPELSATGEAVASAPLPTAVALFEKLREQFRPVDQMTVASKPTGLSIRKALPFSYTNLLGPGHVLGRYASSPDEFSCAIKDQVVNKTPGPVPDPSWGHVISYALRNRSLARALGLLRDFSVPIADPTPFAEGGWVFVKLDPADPHFGAAHAAHPAAVRSYASRLPALVAARTIFAPMLFPVHDPALPPLTPDQSVIDRAFREVDTYAEGFAMMLHARQPESLDAATGTNDVVAKPGADAGIQIGWDDEQVLEWHNRQIEIASAHANGMAAKLEAPLGVLGYRIDVREPVAGEGPFADTGWTSLMDASSDVPAPYRGLVEPFDDELVVEPTPTAATPNATFWLPLYFAQWRGRQIGLRDDTPRLLAGGVASGKTKKSPAPTVFGPSATAHVPPRLRYGRTYQFRVRLADLAGAGPARSENPLKERATQRATLTFKRFVSPKPFGLKLTNVAGTQAGTALPQVTRIDISRPRIGYPEALFTQRYAASDAIAEAARTALLAQLGYSATGAPPATPPVSATDALATGLPDGDVTNMRVTVEVRMLANDPGDDPAMAPLDLGAYVTIYEQTRPIERLPALDPDRLDPRDLVRDVALAPIEVTYRDVPDVFAFGTSQAGVTSGPLVLPRARDVRVRIAPIAEGPGEYFGTFVNRVGSPPRTQPAIGVAASVGTRAPSAGELDASNRPIDLLAGIPSGKPGLCAMYFQPVPDGDPVAGAMSRMAGALDLVVDGLTLRARPGERVVFGAGAGFKAQVAPDASALTFGSAAELFAKWTVVAQASLARDWTWDGAFDNHVTVRSGTGPPSAVDVAKFPLPRMAPAEALAVAPADRSTTRIVFIDAIDPAQTNLVDGHSARPPIRLAIDVRVEGDPDPVSFESEANALELPLVIPPHAVPTVRSAGYALSEYVPDVDYASTNVRDRRLWLELAEVPVAGDTLFARVLANAPDPVLYTDRGLLQAPPPAEPPLPLDAEYMRLIVPGQAPDTDGLEAMQRLVPANDDVTRYLLPLPPGVDASAPELFGFYTYELRFGHAVPWSTAHGRFGRPLRLAGVQHPAPPLLCDAQWKPGTAVSSIVADVPAAAASAAAAGETANANATSDLAAIASGVLLNLAGTIERNVANLVERIDPRQLVVNDPTSIPTYTEREIVLTAPYATPVRNGSRVGDGQVFTTLGFLLYAQVLQSDGSGNRNVLIARTGAVARGRTPDAPLEFGIGTFAAHDVELAILEFGLPTNVSLSAIAVEFFAPGGYVGSIGRPILNDSPSLAGAYAGRSSDVVDPFANFTQARILRASPLTPVRPIC